jgi:hypothetical protein
MIRAFERRDAKTASHSADLGHGRFQIAAGSAQSGRRLDCSGRSDALYDPLGNGDAGNVMSLFNRLFDTRTLIKIIGVLSALLVMKGLGAYFGFSWMAALASG